MAVLVPHFDLPFRLSGTSFAVVEQDSAEDIANCVEAIVRTLYGFRDDSPEFGLDEVLFGLLPLDTADIASQIQSQEPRASVLAEEQPDLYDKLVTHLNIEVS